MTLSFSSSRRSGISVAAWGVVAVVGVILGLALLSSYSAKTTDTATVTDKERVCDGDGNGGVDCKYLVYTDHGTYRLEDGILAGRWSSSDAYGRIKRCHRYEITSYGYRIPLFSSYPNIDTMKDLGRDETCEP